MARAENRGNESPRAAVLTPIGQGGIGVVRVAGAGSVEIVDRLFRSPRGAALCSILQSRSHARSPGRARLVYGLIERRGERLDEVIVRLPAGAERAAGFPVLDINCHGGITAVRRVLDAVVEAGAKRASWEELAAGEPGLDAVQGEASALIPRALTRRAVHGLLAQHNGALSAELARLRLAIGRLLHEDPPREESARERLDAIRGQAARLLRSCAYGKGLWEPRRLVVCGRPNVGKSTLVNALLDEERVLVQPEPGTTRDAVETTVSVRGVPFILVDTAGLRPAADAVEVLGIEQAWRHVARADLVLFVLDAARPIEAEDRRLHRALSRGRCTLVLNKCDLPQRAGLSLFPRAALQSLCRISALKRDGLRRLEDAIEREVRECDLPEDAPLLFTDRQERLIRRAQEALVAARAAAEPSQRKAALQEAAARMEECLGADVHGPLHAGR